MAQIGPFGPAESFSALEQLFAVLCRNFDRGITTIRLTEVPFALLRLPSCLDTNICIVATSAAFSHPLPPAHSSYNLFA